MTRSAESRIGIGRWLFGTGIVGVLLLAVFSLAAPGLLEGGRSLGISAQEVATYAALFDRRPQEASTVRVENYDSGGSRKDGPCLLEEPGSTTLVEPGMRVRVLADGQLLIDTDAASAEEGAQ